MRQNKFLALAGALGMFASVVVPMESARAAATIIVNNVDAPGVGFNDPTPAAPIAGNAGTTLGQQRLIAFSYAASIWGANVTSSVPIVIEASWVPLSCTAVAATLGSASATEVFSDFNGAPRPSTWYPFALANKLSGVNLDPGVPQIRARFNINLGGANCLAGSGWYYGLDGDEGTNVDFVATLMHELAHGLGFQTYTSGSTGAFLFDVPSIWDHYLVDASTGKRWTEATAAERVASAISVDKLVWSGPIVTAAVPSTLRTSRPGVGISGPASGPLNGTTLLAGAASFGPALTTAGVTADVMPVAPTSSAAACTSLTALDALAVRGRIALIDRGTCTFAIKVKNAQIAGAIGVLIADNVAGSPPPGLGGTDPTITIPAVRITKADGDALKIQLRTRSRTASGVVARIGLFGSTTAGVDALGRALMFAPNPFQSTLSVSHFDSTATPNQLMEPVVQGDVTQSVTPPNDLTLPLLQDIGW